MPDPPADILAAKLTPILQAEIASWEPELLDKVPGGVIGSAIGRWFVAAIYPFLLSKVPALVAVTLDFFATTYGTMTLNDLLAWLSQRLEQIRTRPTAPRPSPTGGEGERGR